MFEVNRIKFNSEIHTIVLELKDISQIEEIAEILKKPLIKRGRSFYVFDGIIVYHFDIGGELKE